MGLWFLLATALSAQQPPPYFLFDKPDETIQATLLENPNFYDAGIAVSKEGLWLAWLEFQPGKGDQLRVGLRGTNGWIQKTQLTKNAGDYANPTVTVDRQGSLWLTYEAPEQSGNWDVFVHSLAASSDFATRLRASSNPGVDIQHAVAADPTNGIWIVWQSGVNGQFHISGARLVGEAIHPLFKDSGSVSQWQPATTVGLDGGMHLIWDEFDGRSYDIFAKTVRYEPVSKPLAALKTHTITVTTDRPLAIASKPNFEAHAQIAAGKDGKLWVAWEEDGENWGQRYTARTPGIRTSTHMTDKVGPLHRYRKLHFAEFDEKNERLTEYELPQPSFELARNRTNAPPGLKDFGAFYEHAQLAVDGQNRPWIVYRHFYVPWIGLVPETHKQEDMRLYARCLLKDGWSKLYSFDIGQGDGTQRISVSPEENGIAVAWTTGRTDRRTHAARQKEDKNRGVAIAEIRLEKAEAKIPASTETRSLGALASRRQGPTNKPAGETPALPAQPRQRPSTEFAGKHYELFFGDLHRHTDISLCFSPVDGTIDDAYRYAIDAAPLDFLGITDHTHDLDMGEPLAQIWWRSRKEVDRHALAGRFIPFYSYERSRGDTDHNVISLRDDMMRPHTYPHQQFWKELDTNTFTIPHQPFNPVTWNYHDDAHRPLLEIYQGMRNNDREDDANEALAKGHWIGIIASSDHLSTDASFACVWAEKPTRESIFRAMQGRRTFGATTQLALKVTAGEHWMGERFVTKRSVPIQIEVHGTAPIATVEIFVDGEVKKIFSCESVDEKLTYEPGAGVRGQHIYYVRVKQTDGNRAWSSPIWMDVQQ